MIDWNGKKFINLGDEIYIGDKKIIEIYMGNKKIYPDTDTYPISFAMYCRLDHYVISIYSDTPVNECGFYLYIDEEHSHFRYADVEKVAFVWTIDPHDNIWDLYIYVRFKDGIIMTLPGIYEYPWILCVPFVADNGHIIMDGFDDGYMRPIRLAEYTSGGINFARNPGIIRATFPDKDGNLLTNFTTSVSTNNARLFDNTYDAERYISS